MKIICRGYDWLDTQAKTLETKTIKRAGRTLSWVGISVLLQKDVIIDVCSETRTFRLDEGKYKENKAKTIATLLEEYPTKEAQ